MKRAAALLVVPRPGEVDEHAAHQPGGHREEVRAILPLDAADIDQPKVDLVDERSGLEHVIGTLTSHVPLGYALQSPWTSGQLSIAPGRRLAIR